MEWHPYQPRQNRVDLMTNLSLEQGLRCVSSWEQPAGGTGLWAQISTPQGWSLDNALNPSGTPFPTPAELSIQGNSRT